MTCRSGLSIPSKIGAAVAAVMLAPMPRAQAQQAPLVTPRDLRPQTQAPPPQQLPQAAPAEAPPRADQLYATIGDVTVENGFDAFAAPTQALIAEVRGRRVSVADLYALANAIEQLYHAGGYPLVRLTLPPQRIMDGGTVKLAVIDGFIEAVDVSALPERIRGRVADVTAAIVRQRHLTEAALERALTLAGRDPGVALRSTLGPGNEPGGSVLLLDGGQSLFSATYNADNHLSKSLGTWENTLQLSLNQPLGLGEQGYAYVSGAPNWLRSFRDREPRQVAGGGAIIPLGTDGLSLNPEVTWSDTRPLVFSDLVLPSRSQFKRYTLRLVYPLLLDHRQSLTLTGTFDATTQVDSIPTFDFILDRDQTRVLRVGADWSTTFPWNGQVHAGATLSKGLSAFGARTDPQVTSSGIGFSRFGEDPNFFKLEMNMAYTQPIPYGVFSTTTGRGQAALRGALPTSELFSLDAEDGLSLYTEGSLSDDSGWTLRQEFARPTGVDLMAVSLSAAPYVFGAAGESSSAVRGAPGLGLNAMYGAGLKLNWKMVSVFTEFGRRISAQTALAGNQFFFRGQVQF